MHKTELFNKESMWYKDMQAQFNRTAFLHKQVREALERLYSQLPDVPKPFQGVCSNCFWMLQNAHVLDDDGWHQSGLDDVHGAYDVRSTVYGIIAFIGAHWEGAVRYGLEDGENAGSPEMYFCGASNSCGLWEGHLLERRTQFIEFAIEFLKEKINADV